MARILNIDTSTQLCSVCIADNGQVIAVEEGIGRYDHAEQLTQSIDLCLQQSGYTYQQLDAIAIAEGPGSYTGLRIGASTAKGLCFALDSPLLSVPTLQAMAAGMTDNDVSLRMPLLASRKGEVYGALYTPDLQPLLPPGAWKIEEKPWQEVAKNYHFLTAGSGAEGYWHNNKYEHLTFSQEFRHSSTNMAALSYASYQFKEWKSLIYFEPLYLKPVYIKR